jgi:hypothetical protein
VLVFDVSGAGHKLSPYWHRHYDAKSFAAKLAYPLEQTLIVFAAVSTNVSS